MFLNASIAAEDRAPLVAIARGLVSDGRRFLPTVSPVPDGRRRQDRNSDSRNPNPLFAKRMGDREYLAVRCFVANPSGAVTRSSGRGQPSPHAVFEPRLIVRRSVLKRSSNVLDALKAVARITLEAPEDTNVPLGIKFGDNRSRGGCWIAEPFKYCRQGIVPDERQRSGDHLEQNNPESINVGRRRDFASLYLLRSHICGSPYQIIRPC